MATRPYDPNEPIFPPVPPIEYAGKWVAWSHDHATILAHAETFEEIWKITKEQAITQPVFEKIPRADVRFLGGRILRKR